MSKPSTKRWYCDPSTLATPLRWPWRGLDARTNWCQGCDLTTMILAIWSFERRRLRQWLGISLKHMKFLHDLVGWMQGSCCPWIGEIESGVMVSYLTFQDRNEKKYLHLKGWECLELSSQEDEVAQLLSIFRTEVEIYKRKNRVKA